jgi:hypothetical protein
MTSEKRSNRPSKRVLFSLSLAILFCVLTIHFGSESLASDKIYASALEIKGVVESQIPGGGTKYLQPGDPITLGEKLNLKQGSWMVLMMADSTIRKFNGPASITMEENISETGGSILTRLGSAIVGLLFAGEQEASEVVMVTRVPDRVEGPEGKKSHLPLLVYPAPGSMVFQESQKFEWRKVEGIPLYRVSVYSWDRLLWQATTPNSSIDCPREHCDFKPEETYHWVVEGLIGNSTLRSKPAEFGVLSEDVGSDLHEALSDPDLSILAKIRLCLSLNLYDRALALVDSHWGRAPSDPEAYLLRAEIEGAMGLLEDAYFDYLEASRLSSGR